MQVVYAASGSATVNVAPSPSPTLSARTAQNDAASGRATLAFPMSPTVFREGRYRFYFNSREEDRMHVHVESPEGQLKIWLEPRIELAENHEIPEREVTKIIRIVESHHGEIEQRWHKHRGR